MPLRDFQTSNISINILNNNNNRNNINHNNNNNNGINNRRPQWNITNQVSPVLDINILPNRQSWNEVVSESSNTTLSLINNKKPWNEINRFQNLNRINISKIRNELKLASSQTLNISVIQKKKLPSLELSELSFSLAKSKKEWNEINKTYNTNFCFEKKKKIKKLSLEKNEISYQNIHSKTNNVLVSCHQYSIEKIGHNSNNNNISKSYHK